MTPEKINMVIAASLGWTGLVIGRDRDGPYAFGYPPYCEESANSFEVPYYYGSLDACVGMLEAITKDLWADFVDNLEQECGVGHGWSEMNSDDRMSMIRHTAPQLATAYLKTINKWEACEL